MNDLIEENKAMLEYAKVSGVEFIDVLRKNIAAMELQKSGVLVSRDCVHASIAAMEVIGEDAPNDPHDEAVIVYNKMLQELRAALSAKESEL